MATIDIKTRPTNDVDFSEFYKRNFEKGYRFAFSYIKNEAAYDIVSDVFLKLFERRGDIDANRNIESLFMTMVHNKCFDYLRHEVYQRAYRRSKSYEDTISREEVAADVVEVRELFTSVYGKLGELSEKERNVFVAVRLNGETYKEVAERLSISLRSVEYSVNKAQRLVTDHVRSLYDIAI